MKVFCVSIWLGAGTYARGSHRTRSGNPSLAEKDARPEAATSILQLQGLGKEIWRGIDAQEYVDQERAAWSG